VLFAFSKKPPVSKMSTNLKESYRDTKIASK